MNVDEFKTCPLCNSVVPRIHCGACNTSYWETEKHDCSSVRFFTSTSSQTEVDE